MLAGSCRLPLPALCPPSQDHNVIEAQSKKASSSSSSSASSSASTSSPSHEGKPGWDNIRKALRSGDAIKVAAALGAEGGTFSLAECRLLRAACGVMERTAMEASMQEAEKNLAAHGDLALRHRSRAPPLGDVLRSGAVRFLPGIAALRGCAFGVHPTAAVRVCSSSHAHTLTGTCPRALRV